ncbi:MAG: SCO family protein [Sphingobacteriales bacterium]|nr:MAG: SCO family protein [Sphingobacteriales bacterium]
MSKKNSHKGFIIAIAVAFLLPLSLYLLVKTLSKDKIFLPKFYIVDRVDERTVDGKKVQDTVYHQVADLRLTNQLNEQVSLNNDLKGKIIVMDFFFVNCPSICPKLTGNMTMLQRAFKKNDTSVHLISITVNPERDTPAVLRAYADKFKVNHDHWWFLTGNKEVIYNFARNELGVSVQPSEGGADDFTHTEKIVLIDQQRYIRGYYNGLDTAELRRCADDIVLLTLEKKKKRK